MSYSTLIKSTSLAVEYFVLLQPVYPAWRCYLTFFHQIIPTSHQLWKMSLSSWLGVPKCHHWGFKRQFQGYLSATLTVSPECLHVHWHSYCHTPFLLALRHSKRKWLLPSLIHRDSLDKFEPEVHNGIGLLLYIVIQSYSSIAYHDWIDSL